MAAPLGKCRMCGRANKLVKSHIIPEWAYGRMYGERHDIVQVSSETKKPISFKTTGEWDRILCSKCEESLKTLDEYGRALIFSKPGEPTFGLTTGPSAHGAVVDGVDYDRIKLFQLSVLWRAGVSTREFFSGIKLGMEEPILRKMLLNRTPGDSTDYGCVVAAVRPKPDEMLLQVIDQPVTYTEMGWTLARFLFAGCLWLFVLARQANSFPLRQCFAQPQKGLQIIIGNVSDFPGLVDTLDWLAERIRVERGDTNRS